MKKESDMEINFTSKKELSVEFSNRAIVVSFIMSVFVIFAHANNLAYYGLNSENAAFEAVFIGIIGVGIGRMAVAYFFAMSGYWFFRFDLHVADAGAIIKKKLCRKVRTLLIPYLLWNTMYMLFYMIFTRMPFVSQFMYDSEPVAITFENIFRGVILHGYLFTFWYMKDLIVVTVLTPIIYIGLKCRKFALVLLLMLGILSCCQVEVYSFHIDSLFCFMLGGYMAVYKRKWYESKADIRVSVFCLMFLIIAAAIRYMEMPVLQNLVLILSPVLIWRTTDLLKIEGMKWFYKQSFFVYAVHSIPITVMGKLLARVNQSRVWAFMSYIAAPLIVLGMIYIVARLWSRYMPGFYKLVCGGR